MAVELVDRRALHEHAVPITFLLFALIMLSAACYGFYANTSLDGSRLGHGLTTSLVKIKPTRHGLAQVSLNHGDDATSGLGAASSAGQAANLSFSFK